MRALLVTCLLFFWTAAVAQTMPPYTPGAVVLTEEQAKVLHQSICPTPVHRDEVFNRVFHWSCDDAPNYPRPNSAEPPCSISFLHQADGVSQTKVFFGEFSAHEPQALVPYASGCEPHAMNNGGLAHFKVTERGFEFLHYFPGAYYNDCVVPPGPSATFHTLYCVLNYYGMGLEASFGSVTIPPKGDVEFTLLMDAGYYNGRGPTVDCKGGMERHHFFSLAYDSERRRVVLGVAVPDFGVKDAACRRLAKRDFRSDEDPDNVEYALREHKGLLKETDERYTQAFISYDTSLPLARLKTSAEVVYTNENAPPG